MNRGYTYHDTVRAAHAGMNVLDFYSSQYRDFTRDEWRRRIEKGRIYRNGKQADAEDRLAAGDRLEYSRPPWEEPRVPDTIDVLYDDEHLTVFNKPSGLPVLPGGGYLENTLLNIVRSRHGETLSPLHRLGRGTSGAILFTRTRDASAVLSKDMRDGRISKTYLALAHGVIDAGEFTIEDPIGPVPHPLLGTVHARSENGKPSISRVTVLERRPEQNTTLAQVEIPTGRPHQIRIHLACAGHPLEGDPLYQTGGTILLPVSGSRAAVPGDSGYLLHSWKIVFPHPDNKNTIRVTAPPPGILTPG